MAYVSHDAMQPCVSHCLLCMGLCLPFRDDGVGLAAPQVGVNIRLMVFNQTAKPGDPAETILVNPEIIAKSKTTWRDEEGCLSFPNIFADIEVTANRFLVAAV